MTKADLVERVAREADMTKKDAEQLVEIIFDSITETLKKGGKIEIEYYGPEDLARVFDLLVKQ